MPRPNAVVPAVAAVAFSVVALAVAVQGHRDAAPSEPSNVQVAAPTPVPEVAPRDPFVALYGLGMVPVTAQVDGRIDETTALTFDTTLDGTGVPCDDESCLAGCFKVFAVALDDSLHDISLQVFPQDDPGDVFAETIEPGTSVSAGFCREYEVGADPKLPLRIVARARGGHGRVAVRGWLESIPEATIEGPEWTGPETGAPLPVGAGTAPPANLVRFMASDPHVPLAEVFLSELSSPSEGACSHWPGKAHRWHALDTWGQPVGTVRSTGAEGYAVSGCYEMNIALVRGNVGSGLLASEGYRAPPTAALEPTDAQRQRFDALVADIDDVWPPGADERTALFFRGADDIPTAVIGGRVLVVAAYIDDTWVLRALESQVTLGGFAQRPYHPLAVFDFDGDGTPEIVFREKEGTWWNDVVLQSAGHFWIRASTSVGGGTI